MISEIGHGIRYDVFSQLNFSHTILDNLLKVSIYYEEIISEILIETPEWTWTSLFSEIGGIMGIWLGASIFSVTELLILIASFPYSLYHQKRYVKDNSPM